jgi:TolB-like protein/Tfp pilus assembly protein PilF
LPQGFFRSYATGATEQEYFVDGVVDEITTAISRLSWLFVIARNSSFTYKGRAVDVKQVARELGVRYVPEGSVRKAANRVRITGQLIDTTSGAHIWAERFDGPFDDIFELQDQVASSVLGAIEPRLRLSEIERATRKPTESLDAYDLYLLALGQLRKFTAEGCNHALALLSRALTIDPAYAPAAAMTGWCRVYQLVQGWEQLSGAEIAEGVRLARQAIQAGRHDPDALWMAGYTLSVLASDHSAAAGAIHRALALNPSSAEAWSASGWVACFLSQPGSAIEALNRTMRLSPLDPHEYRFSAGLALAHLVAGRYEDAAEWVDRALREQPRYAVGIRMKIVLCAHMGHIEEARIWLGRLLAIQPRYTIAEYMRLTTYFPPEIQAIYVDGFRKARMPEK